MNIIDEGLVIQVLSFLGKIYPSSILSLKGVLPGHKNRKDIQKHVAYCFEMGLIEAYIRAKDTEGTPVYKDIKLHAKGIQYLKQNDQAG